MALELQKLILQSNVSRLISIRYVTQVCENKKFPGIDGKNSLTFVERFELNQELKLNVSNWFPQALKKVFFSKDDNHIKSLQIPTISDRCWQYLLKLSIEPAQEAIFSPRNFGFRPGFNFFDLHNCLSLNLNIEAKGYQKRVLIINIESCLVNYDLNYLLAKIIAPRSIKLCLSRLLLVGFNLYFPRNLASKSNLSCLFINILLDGIEKVHDSARFGSEVVYFLKPLNNEKVLLKSLEKCFIERGLSLSNCNFKLCSSFEGFDFLGWNFRILNNKTLRIVPSYLSYQNFLLRVKRVINNSNYGSNIKASKLLPIIKEWKIYHRFTDLTNARFSLYFIKRRAFKVFSKEAKQDYFSVKRLLDRCFYILSDLDHNDPSMLSHLDNFILLSNKDTFLYPYFKNKFPICIHCEVFYYL